MTDTFSAKQVATRIGTDPKTLRKFLRSSASPYEAVGQGKRYEFPVADLAEIKAAFNKWSQRSAAKPAPTQKPVTPKPTPPATTKMGPHAVALNDKAICMKCGGGPDDPNHTKLVEEFDDPDAHWTEFDGPSDAELDNIEDLLEDMED